MKRTNPILTPPELEIMRVVWQKTEATVRDVYETLLERKKVAYTTVLTVMSVLEAKGYLTHRREDRTHVYRAVQPESAVERSMVREFLDRVFNGSSRPLLVHLLKDRRLTAEELEDLVKEVQVSRQQRGSSKAKART
jgi:BlaI family transcriptional regulator, penicillinase repressor